MSEFENLKMENNNLKSDFMAQKKEIEKIKAYLSAIGLTRPFGEEMETKK